MEKLKDGKYLLSSIELSSLIHASMEQATKVLHSPGFDPNEDALPYIVNCGYKLLYHEALYDFKEIEEK